MPRALAKPHTHQPLPELPWPPPCRPAQVISELGLSGPKAMGAVMKAVMVRTGGRADNKTVSDLAKAKLKP